MSYNKRILCYLQIMDDFVAYGTIPKSEINSLIKTEMSRKTRTAFRTNTDHRKLSFVNLLGSIGVCVWIITAQVSWAQRVAIFDYDDRHPFPDALALHIEEKLKALAETISVEHFTGKGNEARAVEILSGLDRQDFDLVIVRTSDALINAQHTLYHTPTLYTNVNNPKILGFRTLGPPGGNISGVSYYIPVKKHLSVYKALVPSLRRIGFIFDRNNQSRKAEVPEARTACAELALVFDSEFVRGKAQLRQAVERLITRGADAIVAASSGLIYENIHTFISITDGAKKPVFSFYKEGVKEGAVAAMSSDFFEMADRLLIPMARKVLLENVNPGEMPAAFLEQKRLFINTCQAKKLGLDIPFQILIDTYAMEVEEICP
jgi:putative tryptophan/tyrosine transport system substrate-binding protein